MTRQLPERAADIAAEPDGLRMPRRALAVVGITIPAVLSVLDGAMLNVALPRISADLAIMPQTAVWVISAYQLMTVICLLPMTVVADRFGYRRTFSAGILLYALSSFAAAHSETFPTIAAARILQGVGSAGVMSCASALLRATYPAHLLGTGVALNTSAVTLSAATGPSLGAMVLAAGGNWRMLFLIGVPFCLAAWICARALPETRAGVVRSLGIVILALNVASLGLGIVGLSMLPKDTALGCALLALTCLAWMLWVRTERASPTPLLPLDLFRLPAFSFAIAASASMFAAQSASLIALPFFLLENRGMSVMQAGTMMTAWPICAAATSFAADRFRRRLGVAVLCMTGAVLLVAGLFWVLLLPQSVSASWLAAGFMLGGTAVGFFQAPNMHAMLSATPRARAGAAGSVQAIARVGGAALGAALAGACFALSETQGASIALVGAAMLAAIAFSVNAVRRSMI